MRETTREKDKLGVREKEKQWEREGKGMREGLNERSIQCEGQ